MRDPIHEHGYEQIRIGPVRLTTYDSSQVQGQAACIVQLILYTAPVIIGQWQPDA
jgi:hypothetical protein